MIRNIALFETAEFIELCRSHQVKELYAFGSVARGSDTDTSDVDLLVEIDEDNPISRGKLLLSLYAKFPLYFNKKVDLLTQESIKNPVLQTAIGAEKLIVYAAPVK